MSHLLVLLLRDQNPSLFAVVMMEAFAGGMAAMGVLLWRKYCLFGWPVKVLLYGIVTTVTAWMAFRIALVGIYPRLNLAVPCAWIMPALAMSFAGTIIAGTIEQRGRRSARNVLVAGSFLACGISCMLFIGMAGLVRPFALAYDLTAVLTVMVLGAALYSFALWESGNPVRKYPRMLGAALIALASCVLTFGSLGAILPFDAWMNAVSQPDDVASYPIAVIAGAESVIVLVLGLSGSLVDNRVAAREQLETNRLRQLVDSTLEGILIHRNGDILDANGSIAALLGVTLAELRTSKIARFLMPHADMSVWTEGRGTAAIETGIVAANGSQLPVEVLSRTIEYGGYPAIVTALRDVRERRASEERIHFMAHHDMLTQLPNRVMLNESLKHSLQLAIRTNSPLAVLCIDLDGFKTVNDTLGHAAGDQLLCQVANRLTATMRNTDCVARIGGDEFVVLQTTGAQPEQAAALARRIVECLAPVFRVEGQDVKIGTSIGIALYPQDADTAVLLLKNADIALYRAKESRLGWFCMFEAGMDQVMRDRREMKLELAVALNNDEFVLYFQPLFDTHRQPIAFEALVRWLHPTRGVIPPADFIPASEESGLIIQLGEWVLRSACQAAMKWSRQCRIAVNLSPVQFRRSDLCNVVASVLRDTGLEPSRLELEITEGVLMDNTEQAIATLNGLRHLGVRLVLDDFGTGYSSLSYLQLFPFDKLKIDRSFVQRLKLAGGSTPIVNAIIAMSRSLNLDVTAEGVETIEQFNVLCAQGCHEIQGFFLSPPMPHDAVEPFLEKCSVPIFES